MMAKRVIASYPHLYLDDLYIFKERCLTLQYGKVFGQFTPSVFFDWLLLYWNDRISYIDDMSLASHYRVKEEVHQTPREWFNLARKKIIE